MYFLPVNPWLHVAMGNGPCCMASWWSLLSCGEISEEEDCESERGDRRRNGGNITERKAKHTIQSIETATRRNTQSRNTTSITACRSVIILPRFCVHNKSDAQFPYFIHKKKGTKCNYFKKWKVDSLGYR